MHDVSAAQAVSDAIMGKLGGKGPKPKSIVIEMELGALRFHDTAQVRFWLRELLRKEFGKNLSVKADIKVVGPRIKCHACGFSGKLKSPVHGHTHDNHGASHHHHVHDSVKCPGCGSEDYELVSGSECVVNDVRVTG